MASELQHCPACEEEYVAGVAACVECGGPLQEGPLEYFATRERGHGGSDAPPTDSGTARPNRLLAELPGLRADHTVRALLLEGITCALKCQGVEKVYVPGRPPAEPLAVTLPVSLYVTDAQLEAAQELLASFEDDDVIGEQWSGTETELDAAALAETDVLPEPAADRQTESGDAQPADGEPTPESTSWRAVALIVLAALVLFFLFGR